MLINILYGLPTMSICLMIQVLMVTATLKYYAGHAYIVEEHKFWSSFILISRIMLMLVISNIFQIIIWAVLFKFLGEFNDLYTAVYHSAVNFVTLGYGDIVMSEDHKLLGPFEALNGVLMIGVSTAVLMGIFQDIIRKYRGESFN